MRSWLWSRCRCSRRQQSRRARPRTAPAPKQWDPRSKPIADEVAKLRHLEFDHPVAAEFLERSQVREEGRGRPQQAHQAGQAGHRPVAGPAPRGRTHRRRRRPPRAGRVAPDSRACSRTTTRPPRRSRSRAASTTSRPRVTRRPRAHARAAGPALRPRRPAEGGGEGSRIDRAANPRRRRRGGASRTSTSRRCPRPTNRRTRRRAHRSATQGQSEITAKGVPDSLTVLFQAPYVLGPSMLQAVIAKDDEKGVDALFEDPPFADASFVTPSTLLEHRTFQTVDPPAVAHGREARGQARRVRLPRAVPGAGVTARQRDRARVRPTPGTATRPSRSRPRGRPACAAAFVGQGHRRRSAP